MKKKVVLLILALLMFIPTTMWMVACGETPPGAPGDGGDGGGDQVTNEPCVECVWGEWSVEFPATCGEKGSDIRYCTVCRSPDYRQTPETGEHDYIEGYRQEASCYYAGYQEYYCNVCGDNYHDEIPQRQHNMVLETEILSCDSYGIRRYECSHDNCGYIEEDYHVPSAGHDWGNGTYHEATCLNDAYTYYECQRTGCYQSNTEYDMEHLALGHNKGEEMLDWYQAPTCVDYGYHYFDCTRCEDYIDEQIDRLPHHFVEVETVPATCQEYAYTEYACDGENCYETKTEYDEDGGYADHNFEEWSRREASCFMDGYVLSYCTTSGCGASDEQVFPMLGHDFTVFDSHVTTADCTNGGKDLYSCLRSCGVSEYIDTDPLGHDLDTTTHVCKRDNCYEHKYFDVSVEKKTGYPVYVYLNGLKADMKEEVGETLTMPSDIKGEMIWSVTSENMEDVTEIIIPSALNYINLSGATSLQKLTIPTISSEMLSEYFGNGSDTDYDNSKYVPSTLQEVVISAGNIASYAFTKLTSLNVVTLASDTLTIGDYAFSGCTSLSEIDLKNVTKIEDYVFENTAFTSMTIPAGITVYNGLFKGAEYLETINIQTALFYGNHAFEGCVRLKNVSIAEGMTEANSMFKGCTALVTVDLPDSTKNLANCFEGCTALNTANLPKDSLVIDYAFKGCTNLKVLNYDIDVLDNVGGLRCSDIDTLKDCTNLTTLNIGPTVHSLTEGVFDGLDGLKSLTIPDSITYYGVRVFDTLSTLEEVTTPGGLEIMFTNPATQLANLKKVTVTSDYLDANLLQYNTGINLVLTRPIRQGTHFFMNSTIERVEYVETVYSQYLGSFEGSTTIKTIVVGEGIEEFNANVEGCPNLTTVSLPSTLTKITNCTFKGCGLSTLTLPEGLTDIGEEAFMNMTNLTTINIPSTLTSIGSKAFKGCSKLEFGTLTIPTGLGITNFTSEEFCGIKGITTLKITHAINKSSWTDNAFSGVSITNLETVGFIPRAVYTNITLNFSDITEELWAKSANYTFNQPITSMCSGAFKELNKIDTVPLASSLTEIAPNAFESSTIKNIVLGSNIVTIHEKAFNSCQSLQTINLDNVDFIKNYAFNGCIRLATIASGGVESDALTKATRIYYKAFSGCSELVAKLNLEIATYIGTSAFEGTSIVSLNIYDTVETIEENAFKACSNLNTLTIDCEINKINENAFVDTNNIETLVTPQLSKTYDNNGNPETHRLYIPISNVKYATVTDGYGYLNTSSIVELTITNTCVGTTTYSLPNLTKVTVDAPSIIYRAFANCPKLETLIIGENVTHIETEIIPVENQNQVTINYLGDLEDWISIDFTGYVNNIFSYTDKFQIKGVQLTQLVVSDITEVKTINSYAFASAKFLTSVDFGSQIEVIGEKAFYGCNGLTEVVIEENITKINSLAFGSCFNLATIKFKSALVEVETDIIDSYTKAYSENKYLCGQNNEYVVIDGILIVAKGEYGEKDVDFSDITVFSDVQIKNVANSVFYNEATVVFTTALEKLSPTAFVSNSTATINYMGTQEQWEAIEGVDTLPDTVNVYYNYVPSAE